MNERRNDLEIVKGRATVDARSNSDRSPLYDVRNHASRCSGESKGLRNDVFADDVVTGRSSPSSLFELAGHASLFLLAAPREAEGEAGGARRDRTDDLMLAKHALSQLSYGPVTRRRKLHVGLDTSLSARLRPLGFAGHARISCVAATRSRRRSVVGLGRLELPTSRLSSARSNQLSYKPLTRGASHAHNRRRTPDAFAQRSPQAACSSAKKEKRRRRNPACGTQRS